MHGDLIGDHAFVVCEVFLFLTFFEVPLLLLILLKIIVIVVIPVVVVLRLVVVTIATGRWRVIPTRRIPTRGLTADVASTISFSWRAKDIGGVV